MPIPEAKPDQREWLIVGCVRKPHGVHGDLLVEILTDFPERLQEGVRFGLGDGEQMTLKEIGLRIGITRERVRQIENEALRKLKYTMTRRPGSFAVED